MSSRFQNITLIVAYMLITGVLIFTSVNSVTQSRKLEDAIQNTNRTLCVFVHDLEHRVDEAQQFLIEHPNGIPGISVDVIQQNINNQLRTLHSLSGLNC